jgi:superfamily II DNA or RNA helicase
LVSASASTLEIVWQQNATAYVFSRSPEGTLGGTNLAVGTPAAVRLTGVEPFDARRVDAAGLLALAADPPLEPGGTARAAFALVELAQRAVTEGLVHPELGNRGSSWFAFWGSTLEETVDATLDEIAAALPPVAYDAFDDADEAVRDLYPVLVDRVARDRLRAAKVRLAPPAGPGRQGAPERLLEALAADEPDVAQHGALPSLQRRLADWVDSGLGVLLDSGWHVALHLDELRGDHEGSGALALQLWLHAEDDPTLSLPADLLWRGGGEDAFLFLRASDPRHDLLEQTAALAPLLEPYGIVFDADEPDAVVLDDEEAGRFLRDAIPALQAQGVPVLLPRAWVRTPAKLRLDLTASSGPGSGLLGAAALAHFEWRVAVGDTTLTEEQLLELAAAKEPVLRAAGRWHALQHSDVERALRFLERRRRGAGLIDLVRAVSGVEAAEAGLELGEVRLDAQLAELLHGGEEGGFRPMPTPAGMAFDLFPFQERGLGWLRLLGDLGVGAILADDMGLGKTVQAIALLVSERDGGAQPGPTLVVCPMSVVAQWASEVRRFAPGLRIHVHHGPDRLAGAVLAARVRSSDIVVTSYDIATRDIDDLATVEWDRLLLDEAQDVKNPWTKRARALRRLTARRRLAMTGTPIENRLSELWALMDLLNPGLLGTREWFERNFARPIELHRDERALQRLRALVGPFVLRREKTAVDLELPPITVEKDYCRLTVEQASLYRATVDRWLPRIEEHTERFARRGAVLAMLGQLKQVCNHPELLLPTGRALEGRSGKLERLVELLQGVPDDDKSLVFTQYPGFSRLVPHLEQRLGRRVGFFHGGLHARARQELLAAFALPDGPQIMVISIRAGGRGLNLPAANHVFHFDRWWNPAVEQQATDRVYRLGQRKHVWVHSLICSGTLEERIDQLLDSKRELAESVISGGGDDWLGELDLGAIRAAVALSPEWTEEAAA